MIACVSKVNGTLASPSPRTKGASVHKMDESRKLLVFRVVSQFEFLAAL